MTEPRIVDFYVAPRAQGRTAPCWFVYRQSPVTCIDAASDATAAVEKAVRMAQLCLLGGQSSQVHLRQHESGDWRTVWCAPQEVQRYP